MQTHRQQPVLDPKVLGPALVNGHANGHTGVYCVLWSEVGVGNSTQQIDSVQM